MSVAKECTSSRTIAPKMLYVEEDRELMDQAWELTEAHREDLMGRSEPPAPAVQDKPSVIALLQRASGVA